MSDDNINFYSFIKNKKKYHNPGFKKHNMEIPFRSLVIGPTGSMKTNSVFNLMKKMTGTFESIVVCCKDSNEPLYDYLREKVPPEMLIFFENGEIPDIDNFKDCPQTLIIFDDLVLEKDQSKITEFFIRGRKMGEGISMCYLTQSYYDTPKTVRCQCNYTMMKSIPNKRDLHMILNEWSLGTTKEEIEKLYDKALTKETDFFMIDNQTLDKSLKFRRNFASLKLSDIETKQDKSDKSDNKPDKKQKKTINKKVNKEEKGGKASQTEIKRAPRKNNLSENNVINCSCGKTLTKKNYKRHLKSEYHRFHSTNY